MDLGQALLLLLVSLLSVQATRVPSSKPKRQDYNGHLAYRYQQAGLVDNDIGIQYPAAPGGGDKASYALFKKAGEDDRKPVMFPSPPPPERDETTPAPSQETAPSQRYVSLPKNYAFSYSVKDQSSGDDFSHSQAHNGQSTKGEYRVKLPDGRMQIVSYTADNNGYKADVRYVMDEVKKNPNYDERLPNYVHDFSNNVNSQESSFNDHPRDNYYEQYRDNQVRGYSPSQYYFPTAAPSASPAASTVDPISLNHVNSAEYSGDYQLYHQAAQSASPGLGYYAEASANDASENHIKNAKALNVNYLLNLVTPTKHSLPLYQHASRLKVAPQISYETTTQNTEHDRELYAGKYHYNPIKTEVKNSDKNQDMRYHYESLTSKQPDIKQGQGFRPSMQSYYVPALVDVEPPNLGLAQPVQANYVTFPREKRPFNYGNSFGSSSGNQDNSYQANNIENSEVKQEEITTTEESLTMRPHIKYNTSPEKLQNSKPLKSTILHQPASPTPQPPKQYVSQTSSPQYYTTVVTTEIPFNEISETPLNSFEYSGEYYTKPIQEDAEKKPSKTPRKQFSKLVLPVTTIRPNYVPTYTVQHSPSPQPTHTSHLSYKPSYSSSPSQTSYSSSPSQTSYSSQPSQTSYSSQISHQPSYSPQTSHQQSYTQQSIYTHQSPYTPQSSVTPQPSYTSQPLYTPHPSSAPQKFVYLQPSISPMYINSLEDNKPSLEQLSYLKEVPNNSVHLKHNADPTSQEHSGEETPRPYDSVSFSTALSPSPTPLYTQSSTSSEEYSQESLYSFVPSVRHEYDLGNAESSNYSSASSEQDSASTSSGEQVSTTPRAEENKRERKATTAKDTRTSYTTSNISSSSSIVASSRRPQSNQDQKRRS